MGRPGVRADRLKKRIVVAFAGMDEVSSIPYRPAASTHVRQPAATRVRHVIVVGLLTAAVLVALQTVTQLINFGAFDLGIKALDCDNHYSVFGVASLTAQAVAGATIAWRGLRTERHRWAWVSAGAIVVVLVLIRGLTTFNAAALAVPLGYVFAVLCWLTRRDRRDVRNVVWAALILMVTSLLLHKVGPSADTSTVSDYTWSYQLISAVKHGCEFAGWMLLATGIMAGRVSQDD
jgi:hypothetical protein